LKGKSRCRSLIKIFTWSRSRFKKDAATGGFLRYHSKFDMQEFFLCIGVAFLFEIAEYSGSKHVMKFLQAAKHLVILTGAGVSAESGVPTFR
jgi:hypothetical protein